MPADKWEGQAMSRTERFFRNLAWRLTYTQPGPVTIWMNEHAGLCLVLMGVFMVVGNVWCGGWE